MSPLPFLVFTTSSPLYRNLHPQEGVFLHGKRVNLLLAVQKLHGLMLYPGQTFSLWDLLGPPWRVRGYRLGMTLKNGSVVADVGGGLCQVTNALFWATLHTPLSVVERWRHSFDVFPDRARSRPFGSGATCHFPVLDLKVQNNTRQIYQLHTVIENNVLHVSWYCSDSPFDTFVVIERNHYFMQQSWGGYSRHNELWQLRYDLCGTLQEERCVAENHALLTYTPLLS